MKKFVVFLQIFIVLIFFVKIAALGEMMQKTEPAVDPAVTPKGVPANTSSKIGTAVQKDDTDGDLAKAKTLLKSLETKKEELEKKEQSLKSEEQRLLLLKKEILEKIDLLRVQEEKLNTALEAGKSAEGKRYKDLAKVFESAPPAKAGVMLEQLDVQTAAGITMNMKREKAGAIWGYLTPQKAVEITRQITRTGGKQPPLP
jgi:flagellar motility protein MotE (MotC chaperone)